MKKASRLFDRLFAQGKCRLVGSHWYHGNSGPMERCINRTRMRDIAAISISQFSEAKGKEKLTMSALRWRPSWRLGIALAFGIVGAIAYSCTPSLAQITPDATLGAESSVVTPNANVRGFPADLIQGGATRGANLFHSFQEFNVRAGQRVYFANPAGIETILTRVTGNTLSNILGTLGVDGTADLFLLNPNGIIFGPNAWLDVGGSFFATTANAVQFGDRGFWSATNPEAPGLLTIKPSAFFFNQLSAGTIINQSVAPNPIVPSFIEGLRVPNGENIVLLGGNVSIDGGRLYAFGGRIEIGAVAGTGTVALNPDGSLSFPTDLPRADVLLFDSSIGVFAGNGGSVAINARNLDISGNSLIEAGILSGFGTVDSQAGDITLSATGTLQIREQSRIANVVDELGNGNSGDIRITAGSLFLTDGARLDATTFGQGNGGNIVIEARDQVSLDNGADIFNDVEESGNGAGGNIHITSGSLSVANGALITASVDGQGDVGNIIIEARDQVTLGNDVRIRNGVEEVGTGDGGNIRISTGTLSLGDDASVRAFTFGQGNAGDILIEAREQVSLDKDAGIFNIGYRGNGGNIRVTTGSLIANDADLQALSFGQGNAGNIFIEAREQVSLTNNASIANRVGDKTPGGRATGNGGDIRIRTGSLSVIDSGIDASTFEQGNAGNIFIDVQDQVFLSNEAVIANQVAQGATGNGGDIRLSAQVLTVTGVSKLQALTAGGGNAGNVIINARDRVVFEGGTDDGSRRSGAASQVLAGTVGNGGNVEITTGSLEMLNRAGINVSAYGQGNAGNVIINARDNVSLDNSTIFSVVDENAVGRGGNINITTGSLSLTNGGQLDASTFGQGSSGNIIVTARNTVSLDGINPKYPDRSSTLFTEVFEGAQGNGGDIQISTGSLLVTNGAQLDAKTRGRGNAGSIFITARDNVLFDGSSPDGKSTRAMSSVEETAIGIGGNIKITTGSLAVTNGAQLLANTLGQGDAGNIIINARDSVTFDGSRADADVLYPSAAFSRVNEGGVGNGGNIEITTRLLSVIDGAALIASTEGQGTAGNVLINTRNLSLSDRAQISARSSGTGNAGSVAITADEAVRLTNSDITTSAEQASGGAIAITADSLSLNRGRITAATGTTGAQGAANITLEGLDLLLMGNESLISANALNQANGGNVTIDSTFIVATPPKGPEGSDITANASQGNGGRVSINTQGLFGIEFRPKLTPDNDITVSSDFGLAGVFEQNTPGVDPSRGLAELPTEVVDASRQIDRRCSPDAAARNSSFTVTGRGGLPPSPNDPLQGEAVITNWVSLDSEVEDNTPPATTTPSSSAPRQLVEAQGWVFNEKGEVVLTASAPTVTPNESGFRELNCNPPSPENAAQP